jgi:hypothetical protein
MGGRGRIGCASCPKILPSNPSSSRPHHPKEHEKIQHLSVFRCLLSVVRARACTYTPDWQSHALNFAPIFCVAQMNSSLCVLHSKFSRFHVFTQILKVFFCFRRAQNTMQTAREQLVLPHQHRTPGRSRWRIVIGIGASAMALVVVVRSASLPPPCFCPLEGSQYGLSLCWQAALAGTGSAPEPLGLEETWGKTQAAGLLKHTARFQEAGEFLYRVNA